MSLVNAIARCTCDECGHWYTVALDPACDMSPFDQVTLEWVEVLDMQFHKPGEVAMVAHCDWANHGGYMQCPRCTAKHWDVPTPNQVETGARPGKLRVVGGTDQ